MVKFEEFSFVSSDGVPVAAYKWEAQKPKALLQIVHGSVEHAMRYDAFARSLCEHGITVYAEDHLGHGKTAESDDYVGHISDSKGAFLKIVEDMHTLDQRMREENPGLPVFMYGHSMGSVLVRLYTAKYGETLKGVLLTGVCGRGAAFLTMLIATARCAMILRGSRCRSAMLNNMYNDTLSGPFGKERAHEFICSDPAVVEVYNADPRCGNALSAEFFHEMLWGMRESASKKVIGGFPKDLPLFIAEGEFDTTGGGEGLKDARRHVGLFEKAGVSDLTFKIYPGMRHEVLNEKGKQQVWDDLTGWIEKHI
jgi:alpha-beta hydrolase superfamily lysophospholipase